MIIDWKNPREHITKHFKVGEALYLPSWGIYHTPSEKEKSEIMKVALVMEKIRKLFNKPIKVNCWIRPTNVNCHISANNGNNYNCYVGGAIMSMHCFGAAVDFRVVGFYGKKKCHMARHVIKKYLKEFGIRMENLDCNWIHIDTKNINRFFRP